MKAESNILRIHLLNLVQTKRFGQIRCFCQCLVRTRQCLQCRRIQLRFQRDARGRAMGGIGIDLPQQHRLNERALPPFGRARLAQQDGPAQPEHTISRILALPRDQLPHARLVEPLAGVTGPVCQRRVIKPEFAARKDGRFQPRISRQGIKIIGKQVGPAVGSRRFVLRCGPAFCRRPAICAVLFRPGPERAVKQRVYFMALYIEGPRNLNSLHWRAGNQRNNALFQSQFVFHSAHGLNNQTDKGKYR